MYPQEPRDGRLPSADTVARARRMRLQAVKVHPGWDAGSSSSKKSTAEGYFFGKFRVVLAD